MNPVSKTGAKALQENSEKDRVLSFEEQDKYLALATPMLRDVANIMLEMGMRPDEVCRIQTENVHLKQDYLFIPKGKTKAARRRIKLTAAAKSILKNAFRRAKGRSFSLMKTM